MKLKKADDDDYDDEIKDIYNILISIEKKYQTIITQ
tara:strand:+ start:646 stop:753 length:108 start_codon:yes stop_codon:yes gene_type:complete